MQYNGGNGDFQFIYAGSFSFLSLPPLKGSCVVVRVVLQYISLRVRLLKYERCSFSFSLELIVEASKSSFGSGWRL
jgi:hypothetical protein